jgi:hypothetical protein
MRITKKQLKRIIKEEHARILKEYNPAEAGMAAAREDDRVRATEVPLSDDLDALEFAVDEYIKARTEDGVDDVSTIQREIVKVVNAALGDASMASGNIDRSRY